MRIGTKPSSLALTDLGSGAGVAGEAVDVDVDVAAGVPVRPEPGESGWADLPQAATAEPAREVAPAMSRERRVGTAGNATCCLRGDVLLHE